MRRGFLATLFLLCAACFVRADYVVIIADLNKDTQPSGQGMIGGGGGLGGPGMGGGPGFPGGGGPAGPGGPGGPGRPGGPGMGSGRGPGGGGPGMPGGAGGPGMPGGMGNLGGFGPAGGGPANPESADEVSTLVVVVLEIGPMTGNVKKFKLGLPTSMRHRWGTTPLYQKHGPYEATLIETAQGRPLPTVAARFHELLERSRKEKFSTDRMLKEVAKWALEHGLVDEFAQVMDKLAETDKTHTAVAAYLKVKSDLHRPLSKEDVADKWKGRLLRDYRITQDDNHHFALIHGLSKEDAIVKAHLGRLEKNFRSYYYWWSTRGIHLPMPTDRLVAVLTDKGDDYGRLRKTLTASPPVADSFFARRESLAVYAGGRGDGPYLTLEEVTKPLWGGGFDRKQLIRRANLGYPKMLNGRFVDPQSDTVHIPRTFALMLQAMEHEWEQTNSSHEAARQLVFASGLLPQNVNVPEWVMFGMGSFFETPLQSPWSATAAPSTYWLPRFKEYLKANKYESSNRDTLIKVITDGYFRGKSPLGDKATANDRHEQSMAERRARAASWSLTYYLAQRELDGLRRYFKELSRMPRDVELDDNVLRAAFARAFDCVDASKNVDNAKLGDLASRWINFVNAQNVEAEAIHKKIREFYDKMNKPAPQRGGPGGPGFPGR